MPLKDSSKLVIIGRNIYQDTRLQIASGITITSKDYGLSVN